MRKHQKYSFKFCFYIKNICVFFNWIAPVILVVSILVPVYLFGQTAYNPNILPLGDKESLMANTGTGGLNSTGAVYYNPGALTMVEGNSFSLSGSAYMHFRFESKPIANIAGTDLNYAGTGFQTIPTSVIMVRTYKDWHIGFSVLVPLEFNFEGQRTWNIPLGEQNFKLKMLQNYKEKIFLAGLTVSRKLGNGWSAGISLYSQSYSYLSTIDMRGEIQENPDLIIQITQRQKINPVDLLIIGGIHKQWKKLNLGLRVAAPGIYLFGKGNYYDFLYSNFAGPENIETSEIDIENTKTVFKTPLDIRFGTAYKPNDTWTLALDIAYRFGLEYKIFEDERITRMESTQGNFRINGGFEYRMK